MFMYVVRTVCPKTVTLCTIIHDSGTRKKAQAIVSIKEQGTGEWTINGQDITYFPNIIHRYTYTIYLLWFKSITSMP